MATKKHLVLDDDVYLKLKRRKARTKFSAKAIGNSILRASLSHPPLPEVIGEKLIKAGKVSKEEYEQAVTEAMSESRRKAHHHLDDIIKRTERQTYTSGSWEFKPSWQSSDGAFQLLQAWARDGKKVPMSPHFHNEYEFLIVLAGKVQVDIETGSQILKPMDFLCIPPEQIHSSTPLTGDVRMMVITSPAMIGNTPNSANSKRE